MKKTSQKKLNKGFTLIEMLIVIGILAVLAVVALLALNPGEAQKKSRDIQRMKDLSALQAIVQQYLDDGGGVICPNGCRSNGLTNTAGVYMGNWAASTTNYSLALCTTSWLGGNTTSNTAFVDLCRFTSKIQIDPRNKMNTTVVSSGAGDLTATALSTYYYIKGVGADYVICSRMESVANKDKVVADSINDSWFAIKGGNVDLTSSIYKCQ